MPELTLNTDGAFCAGDSTLITAKESYGSDVEYKWGNAANYTDKSTYMAKEGGTYQVYARAKKGGLQCATPDPVAITVTEVPLPTISGIEVTGKPCKGERVSLRPRGSNSTSFEWFFITSTKVKVDTTRIERMESIQPTITQDTTFYVVASNTQTFTNVTLVCKGAKDTTLTLLPDPAFTLTANTPCYGNDMVISAQGGTGYTYDWTWDGNQNENGKDDITIRNAVGSHVFHVTATTADGCSADKDTLVNIHSLPIINGFQGENVICVDNQSSVHTVICDDPAAIRRYEWTTQSSNGFQYSSAPDSSKITIKPNRAQDDVVYTVNVTDTNGCASSKNYEIDIKPMPETNVAMAANCPSDPTNITVTDKNSMNNVTYTWYEYDDSKTDHKGDPLGTGNKLEKEIADTTRFVVTASSEFGCEKDTTITATVHPLPTLSFSGETVICEGPWCYSHNW